LEGKQHRLADGPKDEPDGPTYRAAVKRFAEILHCAEADKAEDDNLVITILDRYAVHLKNAERARSLEMFENVAGPAVAEFGGLKYKELKIMHIQAWLDKMGQARGEIKGGRARKASGRVKRWGNTMKGLAVDKLQAAFSWAEQQGMISRNLLDGRAKKSLGIKRRGSRGRDYVIQPGEHAKLCSVAKPYFVDLLTFLHGTGCRPGEVYNATAKHYDRKLGAIVFPWQAQPPDYVHKTAQKTE
jgi:hypothetical protein